MCWGMVRIPQQTKERKNMIENLTSNTFNEAWIASVWKKLTREVAYKTYNTHLPLTAEDIASKAITYALKPGINGTGEFPTSEKQLLRTARKIAKWAIIDAVKKANKMLECESTDDTRENDDGTIEEISPYEAKHAAQQFREEKNHRNMMAIGRTALNKLDAVLAMNGVSKRDIEIYKARDLYREPTDIVCAKHSVTPENLYKIVSVIKGILRRHGRSIIQD